MAKSDKPVFDKDALLNARDFDECEIEIPGFGTITVRAVSRREFMRVGEVGQKKGVAAGEALLVSIASVEPKFTEEDVRKWQQSSAGHWLEGITREINKLSGLDKEAKEATLRFS